MLPLASAMLQRGSLSFAMLFSIGLAATTTAAGGTLTSTLAAASLCDDDGEWRLVWRDEFDSAAGLNTTTWTVPLGTGNSFGREANVTAADTYVDDGNLVLRSRVLPGSGGKNWTTGAAITHARGSPAPGNVGASWRYGRFCVRAKLPGSAAAGASQGLWPAHWMAPADHARHCGYNEIDIMEMINGDGRAHATYWYWGPGGGGPPGSNCSGPPVRAGPSGTAPVPDFSAAYHEYAVEWTPTRLAFFVDGAAYASFDGAGTLPVNDHYMMLNTAVGGGWPGSPNASTESPAFHLIDYVRVAQKPDYG